MSPCLTRAYRASSESMGRTLNTGRPERFAGGAILPPLVGPVEPLRIDPCPPKTRSDLEWDRVLASVAGRCAGPLGRELALALPFAATREQARDALAQSAEA